MDLSTLQGLKETRSFTKFVFWTSVVGTTLVVAGFVLSPTTDIHLLTLIATWPLLLFASALAYIFVRLKIKKM